MTISSTYTPASFSGNDVADEFAFTFKVFAEADLVVVLTDALGVETTQTITTHYTVSLNADQNNNPGGTVTMVTIPATGETLTIAREVDATQETDVTNGGGFYPEVLENALDKLTMLSQQNSDAIARTLRSSVAGGNISELPTVAERASKYMAFDANGDPVATSGTENAFVVSSFAETFLDDADGDAVLATLGIPVSAFIKTLLDDATETEAKTTLGVLDKVVQYVEATPITAVTTCSTAFPANDDTIPQNTEGTEVITVSITPTSATNRLRIEASVPVAANASGAVNIIGALFQDSTANALAVGLSPVSGSSSYLYSLSVVHEMAAGTTSATTFKLRVGAAGATTAYLNANGAGARFFGGISAVRLRVTEYAV